MLTAFGNIPPVPEVAPLQREALSALATLRADAQRWYQDPVTSVVDGAALQGGELLDTTDAWGRVNGKQRYADAAGEARILAHCQALAAAAASAPRDYRAQSRRIEERLLKEKAGELVANQAVDFMKQNGFEEIAEWTQASAVEQRLNDQLLAEEAAGKLEIRREPAFVGCVSNFSNFLDLSRKVLRNIEAGVPVVVLSRDQIGQHMYRWFQILVGLMREEGMPPSLVTFASLSIPAKQRVISALKDSPMYFTGSRAVARELKKICPNLMAGMVGPNTMVASKMTPQVAEALRWSSVIETAGQCTHVRHFVAPGVTTQDLDKAYDSTVLITDPKEGIERWGQSPGLYGDHPTTAAEGKLEAGYAKHPRLPAAYVIRQELPPVDIDEKWRQVYLDVTDAQSVERLRSDEFLSELADWLVQTGPITLAVNDEGYSVAKRLFETSSMTVYNVGTPEKPALNVSALPQENEAFGEFPDRSHMSKYTKFPVIVPSATPAYHANYATSYLEQQSAKGLPGRLAPLAEAASSPAAKGYLRAVYDFLVGACGARDNTQHPHRRTAVWGWQRPPLNGQQTVLRATAEVPVDAVAIALLPFLATNASECAVLSYTAEWAAQPGAAAITAALGSACQEENDAAFEAKWKGAPQPGKRSPYNVVEWPYGFAESPGGFSKGADGPLAAQLLTLFFPLGHCKSMNQNDAAFAKEFKDSEKWLRVTVA